MDFSYEEGLAPMAIEKIKILGVVLELPAKQHRQFSPFGPFFEVIVPNTERFLCIRR
jgi:hypothetical protein